VDADQYLMFLDELERFVGFMLAWIFPPRIDGLLEEDFPTAKATSGLYFFKIVSLDKIAP